MQLQFQILFLEIITLFESSFFKSHSCCVPPLVTFTNPVLINEGEGVERGALSLHNLGTDY